MQRVLVSGKMLKDKDRRKYKMLRFHKYGQRNEHEYKNAKKKIIKRQEFQYNCQ